MEMDAYVRAGRGTCGPRGDGVVMISVRSRTRLRVHASAWPSPRSARPASRVSWAPGPSNSRGRTRRARPRRSRSGPRRRCRRWRRRRRGVPQPEGVPNDLLRGPEDSSPWGLDHHHEDLAFYPAGYYNPGFYSPLSTKPSCLVRITRDAGQNATGLIIDEFNWYFPRTEIGQLRVNTEFIRS